MVIGSFTVISLTSGATGTDTDLESITGLAKKKPLIAVAFTVFLLGQAGIPLTSGFFAKFYVIEAAIEEGSFGLAIMAMLAAVIGAFLYLRILVKIWLTNDESEETESNAIKIPIQVSIILVVSTLVTMFLGVWPEPLVEMVRRAVPVLLAS